MSMNFDQFIAKYNGRYIDYDGKFSAQCVDLMRQYVKDVDRFLPYIAIPQTGWAKNIFTKFSNNSFYRKVLNTPQNIPQKGDIVFWGTYPFVTGLAGHVAVFQQGDVHTLITFDQNWPTGSPCHLQKHSYRGVLGWLQKQ